MDETDARDQITPMSVEIKALRIDGKQVTEAMFRQLTMKDILDYETGAISGHPLGTVNYFWGPCNPDHLHVVWQADGRLYRSCSYPVEVMWERAWMPGVRRAKQDVHTAQARLRQAAYCAATIAALEPGHEHVEDWQAPRAHHILWPCGVQLAPGDHDEQTEQLLEELHNYHLLAHAATVAWTGGWLGSLTHYFSTPADIVEARDALQIKLRQVVTQIARDVFGFRECPVTYKAALLAFDQAAQAFGAAVHHTNVLHATLMQSYATLQALGQLFIEV